MTLKLKDGCQTLFIKGNFTTNALFVTVLLFVLISPFAHGGEHEGKEEKALKPGTIYYNLPPVIVSFKGEKRLRFLKVDVALRLRTSDIQNQVSRQLPRIRNDLIMLFSRQPEASLVTREGKEEIRLEALKKVQDIIAHEESGQGIMDLLFMNFVVQN